MYKSNEDFIRAGAEWIAEHRGASMLDCWLASRNYLLRFEPEEFEASVDDKEFEVFWSEYDKKVGKVKAKKLWSKLSLSEKEECMRYIPLYKQNQPNKAYRKDPERFLRNKCWNDELINTESYGQQQKYNRFADYASVISNFKADSTESTDNIRNAREVPSGFLPFEEC